MRPFDVVPDLKIGSIIEVSGTSVRVELDGGITELTRSYEGRVYAVGQIASIVKIHFGRRILFAYVRLLRMRSDLQLEAGANPLPPERDQRIMEVDLFGEGIWHANKNSLDFSRGVTTYPLPLQGVYLMSHHEVQAVFSAAENQRGNGENPLVELGRYVGAEAAIARANINKMFGQHCAILGSTGSGKSATVAALLHGVLNQPSSDGPWRPRIIVIDPHGEYAKAFGDRAIVYRAYETQAGGEEASRPVLRLPYWLMSGDEFRSLIIGKTEEEATSQNNIVYKSLAHARMVQLNMIEPAKEWVGNTTQDAEPDAPRPLSGIEASRIEAFDRDMPYPFSLDEFKDHIIKEQGINWKTNKWDKKSATDFKSHRSILDKLNVLRADPRLDFMMKSYVEGEPDLAEIIEQFVGAPGEDKKSDIRIIDISGLPNEVAGPLTAVIARLLFQYKVWQTRAERERDPVLLVCEEAHRYVPNHGQAEYEGAQTAIRRLAREGRKYGLGLMLVSQRPADVESTVLSQCNSWVILRLTNSADQEHVSRFLPDSLSGLTKLLPSLVRREAIFVGEAAAIPARIKIRELTKDQLPDSNDITFADGWAKPPIGIEDIEKVVRRWRRESQ
ncbi:ATP-binding protein [Methylosarcina fibrata]|uniref:ATP-binding protein n=1 Tax=Methylosarcina fibrata TaxID=105972 RepID=UPI0003647DE4|nr:ATP-binding protein [Methylosarcina fibrata]